MKKIKLDQTMFGQNPDNPLFKKAISREETKRILGGGALIKTTTNTDQATTSHDCDPCGIDIQPDGGTKMCQSC